MPAPFGEKTGAAGRLPRRNADARRQKGKRHEQTESKDP